MRDLAFHGDDLLAATHGRGFWVLDDISALRQLTPQVAASDAYLFRPGDAYDTPPPGENGTPQPRDEPFAENPPHGAFIDYYLKAGASGPLTIEILDSAGALVRKYSSDEQPAPVNPDTLNIPAFWVRPQAPPSAVSGMHRWVWDLRHTPVPGGRGRGAGGGFGRGPQGAPAAPGTYTVRLTVNGKASTQPLTVKADPRGPGPYGAP